MAELEMESVYACDVHTFWEDFYFLKDYGRAVYVDGLGFKRWELQSAQDDGQTLSRVVLLEKPLAEKFPKALRKLAGESLVFTEHGTFDRSRGVYDLTLVADRFQKNGRVKGRVTAEPHPEGCLRRVHLEVKVNMLGLGKLIEGTLLEAFASGYRDGVQFGNAMLAARPAQAAQAPTPSGTHLRP